MKSRRIKGREKNEVGGKGEKQEQEGGEKNRLRRTEQAGHWTALWILRA